MTQCYCYKLNQKTLDNTQDSKV